MHKWRSTHRWHRFVSISLSCLMVIAAAAACGTNTSQNQHSKQYGEDGYLGLTNSNPNLQTSPSYHTYRKDIKMMSRTLSKVPGVQDARYTVNGNRVHIRIKVDERLSPEEAYKIEQDAYRSLLPIIPRYQIKITSNINR